MRLSHLMVLVLVATTLLPLGVHPADKPLLQATAQLHLDRISVDGAIIHLDAKTAEFIELYTSQTHPEIFQIDDKFVLCADLVRENGERRTIDIYVVESDGQFKVVETIIGDRRALMSLMSQGRATRLK